MAALRTQRDRAMVQAMLLGGLRRCEVLGLRLEDLHLGEWRVFVDEGKGGHQRLVPVSPSFFATVAAYMDTERPPEASTDRVFVVLKGRRRGEPLSAEGLDEIISGARARAGLAHGTCHELRHTCFTRLREAGMSIEALQAQAGHRSIASTQLYLHLGEDWLADEYRRAAEAIEAQATVGMPPMTGRRSSPAPEPSAGRRCRRRSHWAEIVARGAADGGDHAALPRPAGGVVSAVDRRGRGAALRQFAAHVTPTDPACTSVAAIERRHIESYKRGWPAGPGRRGRLSVAETIRHDLGMLRTFFERIIDWDYADAPAPGPDLRRRPAQARRAAPRSSSTTPPRRSSWPRWPPTRTPGGGSSSSCWPAPACAPASWAVSRDDAMVRIGDTYWLRIPLGKLHNDRSVPLHPMLVGLINDYRPGEGRPTRACSSNATTISPSTGAPSTATSQPSADEPGSATSTLTSCATPWPPRPSTAACPSRPSPRCSVTARCA